MKKFENFLNESSETFTLTLGRAFTGFQKSCYKTANTLNLDIDIERIPGVLDVTYRVTVDGNKYNIIRFTEWVNHNYTNRFADIIPSLYGDEGEYEEEQ